MGKGSTTIIYVALVLFFLLLVSFNTHKSRPPHHRRLKLRSSFSFDKHEHHNIPFDPIIADIERHREDKEWEKQYFADHHNQFQDAPAAESQPEWEEYMDAEDYVNDEDHFNVSYRLYNLFPVIDVDPADGFLSVHELAEWNLKNAQKEVMHRTERDMEVHDKNHDMLISFDEYEPPSWARRSRNRSDDRGWWKQDHFNASDRNGDGFLNKTEFNDFLHPADTDNTELLKWLCKEEIRERDSDGDGKLDYKEFLHGIFDVVRDYEERKNFSNEATLSVDLQAKRLFAELDLDKDGFLTAEELLPVINRIHPSERFYAKQQADYMITQADADKDGRLSLAEMIENPYVFYSAIFNEDDDDDYFHDEFR